MNDTHWAPLQPALAADLSDARRQLHHAAQFGTALGISYLPHAADDSHTNLEWLSSHRALASNAVRSPSGSVRVAVSIADLSLRVLADDHVRSSFALRGETIDSAAAWVRTHLDEAGLSGARYTLARHYEILPHAVADGAPFSAEPEHLEQLARWFGNAAAVLDAVRAENRGDPVRCWPHHFDIATLITVRPKNTVGVGLEPGDAYYSEPYFYVNANPQPAVGALTANLEGNGRWHTHEWIGAVLPASSVMDDASGQAAQAKAFLESAVRACRSLLG